MSRSYGITPETPRSAASVDPRDIIAGYLDCTVDPAWVSPVHLPALAHTPTDLDDCGAPIKVVEQAELGRCGRCDRDAETAGNYDAPIRDADATVVGYHDDGSEERDLVCGLHLYETVRHHQRAGRTVVVEVPSSSQQWFSRTDRETYYALDEQRGVAVVQIHSRQWAVALVASEVVTEHLAVLPVDEGWEQSRLRAEVLAQAVAAQIALDEFLAADVDVVALPVAVETEAAA